MWKDRRYSKWNTSTGSGAPPTIDSPSLERNSYPLGTGAAQQLCPSSDAVASFTHKFAGAVAGPVYKWAQNIYKYKFVVICVPVLLRGRALKLDASVMRGYVHSAG